MKFRASSDFIFYFPETHGQVKAKIGYSVDAGGSWDLIEPEYVILIRARRPTFLMGTSRTSPASRTISTPR